jgi:hypothetical protein
VDSALLRFVSEQKNRQEQQLDMERAVKGEQPTAMDDSSATTSAETALQVPPLSDQLDPWMGQYNRNRVAQKLVALGAEECLALKAGEKVQSYVLVRTARRRIRVFLKERDSLWKKPGANALSASQQQLRDDLPHPNYGFDDVVDVLLEFGLTGKDICTILTHSPSLALMMPRRSFAEKSGEEPSDANGAMEAGSLESSSGGETLHQTMSRSFSGLLLTTLGLRKYDARKVLRSCPGLLSVRGSKSAVQVVAMMSKLGVSTSSVARDKTALPVLLSRSPAGLFRLVSFLSSDTVRMPIQTIGPLIRRALSKELLDAVTPVPRIQQQPLESADASSNNDDNEIAIDPNVESALWGKTREERKEKINEVYRNMTANVATLRNEIGANDLGKVIAAYPSVLLLDAEEQILPTASYLMDELGIVDGNLPSVLQQYPILLGEDVDEMKKKAAFLLYLGVEEEDLGSIFRAFPALFTLDIETQMAPVVNFLTTVCRITDIGAFITRLPPVLGYSVEKELQPKWDYIERVCLQASFELAKFPAYFSYPFERVIKTRYDYLGAKGIPRQMIPIDAVLRFGDADFAKKVAKDDDGGAVFSVFSEKRQRGKQPALKKRQQRPNKAIRTDSS